MTFVEWTRTHGRRPASPKLAGESSAWESPSLVRAVHGVKLHRELWWQQEKEVPGPHIQGHISMLFIPIPPVLVLRRVHMHAHTYTCLIPKRFSQSTTAPSKQTAPSGTQSKHPTCLNQSLLYLVLRNPLAQSHSTAVLLSPAHERSSYSAMMLPFCPDHNHTKQPKNDAHKTH